MGTAYTRQSTLTDGDTITAALFNDEYNQLLTSFSYAASGTTGHQHDGTAGEGGNIAQIGDQDFLNKIVVDSTNNRWGFFVQVSSSAVEQIRIQDGAIVPVTDDDIDLGTSSLQFKNAYFDGTVEADAITIAGVTLSETIADTVGAMVTSNSETGIAVTYDDNDNTLDFAVGTLNQDTTGNAATATILETARTIGGTSFNGSANIAVALAATATTLATARTIHGVSFDGSANIDLAEVISDTVGAMFSGNTETGITVTYQDDDNTIDLAVTQDTSGNAATATEATNVTVTANNTENETVFPVFVDGATGTQGIETDTSLTYNPSTNLLGVTGFAGTGAVQIPAGTTAQRPSAVAGQLRYNATTGKFEGYTDDWGDIGGGESTLTINTMTGDGSDTTLTMGVTPPTENAIQVYFDGVYQHKDNFSFSGTTLTFSTAPASGVKVEVIILTSVLASTTPGDGTVTTAKLASNAVTTVKITDANVTTAKIADDAVTAAKLASNAVVTASIVDDNVTQAKIADDAVGADQLAASAVVTASMVDDAVTTAKIADDAITSALIADDAIVAAAIADNAVDIARLNVSDGSAGQSLTTNGSGTLSFATVGGLYNDWLVKTANFTMASGDQIIGNHASTAFTLTLPASPSAGAVVTVKNVGAALITVGRNSSNINSVAGDALLPKDNAATLVYVDSTIGWTTI